MCGERSAERGDAAFDVDVVGNADARADLAHRSDGDLLRGRDDERFGCRECFDVTAADGMRTTERAERVTTARREREDDERDAHHGQPPSGRSHVSPSVPRPSPSVAPP